MTRDDAPKSDILNTRKIHSSKIISGSSPVRERVVKSGYSRSNNGLEINPGWKVNRVITTTLRPSCPVRNTCHVHKCFAAFPD